MPPTVAALVDQYRAARDARRAAGQRYRAEDTDNALDALNRAMRDEQHAAVCVASALADQGGA